MRCVLSDDSDYGAVVYGEFIENMSQGLALTLEFSGGAELLFDKVSLNWKLK